MSKKELGVVWLVPVGVMFVFVLLLFLTGDKENEQYIDTTSIQIKQ